MFTPDERSCNVFSTRNNCCEFLASHGVAFQSFIKSFFKTLGFGAALSYSKIVNIQLNRVNVDANIGCNIDVRYNVHNLRLDVYACIFKK